MGDGNQASGRSRIRLERDARRRQLTAAARDIFVEEGYTALTLRAVAARCNVRLSTVQHHFGGRPGLIDAVMDDIIDECVAIYGRYAETAELDGEERLRRTVATLIAQNESEYTALLFPELWALAQRDPAADRGIDRLYAYGRQLLTRLILNCYPQASEAAAMQASQLVLALTDGLLISSGVRHGRSRSTENERQAFVAAALSLVTATCAGVPRGGSIKL